MQMFLRPRATLALLAALAVSLAAATASLLFAPSALALSPPAAVHILWTNTDGRASLWTVAPDGSLTTPVYGPFPGWTAQAVSDSPDGTPHILWTNSSGEASVWNVGTGTNFTSHEYGPYPGYAAVSLSSGGDGMSHLLWNRTDEQASAWTVDTVSGGFTHAEYGPYSGWIANAVASGATVTDLLWTNTDGRASGYRFAANGSLVTSVFGPFPSYAALSLAVGPDDGAHLLWNRSDGLASLWSADFSTGGFTHTEYGPFSGWSAKAIATGPDNVTHVLWDNADGTASLWNVSSSGATHTEYGPFADWTAVAVSAGASKSAPAPTMITVINNPSAPMGFSFAGPITVQSGASVTWNNTSRAPHSIVWDAQTPAASPPPGAGIGVFSAGTMSAAWIAPTVTVSTTYNYHCGIHGPTMAGQIIVNP